MTVDPKDLTLLIRDKYAGDTNADMREDIERLASGEPLAYVIGWLPFLGLSVRLDSHPLIPRPETEWWTEVLIEHLRTKYPGPEKCFVLDLCAGSGAIGLSVLSQIDNAHVSFAELSPLHCALIAMNTDENDLDVNRITTRSGDLFVPYEGEKFHIIATNPPYVPSDRELETSVVQFEPKDALYAGPDGLDIIRRIVEDAPAHLLPGGELWMECDIENIEQAQQSMRVRGFQSVEIRNDLYGRPRIVVGYFS
jgi:release factor glutamine methyltransferase